MNGRGGQFYIYGVLAGTLEGWELRRADDATLTFTAEGTFLPFWLSAGATRATARAVKTQSPGRGHRPAPTPATPIELRFEGEMQELTLGRVVLRNVRLMKGAD